MNYSITATKRTSTGRRAKTELKQDRVPAVVYGRGIESQNIAVPRAPFVKVLREAGSSSLIELSLEGQTVIKVLIKEVQRHPLTTNPVHVDFYQVRMDEKITANVPLVFTGESKAVKEEGGTLIKSLDEIEIRCLPGNLPHEIVVDLSALATFDDAITVGQLSLPAGVEPITDAGITIATVSRLLTEDELKKLEEGAAPADVSAVKTEGEEKRAAEEAKKAEEAAL